MTMTDRTASVRLVDADARLGPSSVTAPLAVPEEGPAAPSGVLTCSLTLPRDVLVRLAGLSRQVDQIHQGHVSQAELSLQLGKVRAGLGALVQSIHDEIALHYAGRRR